MTAWAYYNDNDEFAAAWLRNLIAAGHIAPGEVDDRSIRDVRPDDLRGFSQCHFFAGIGGWSLAARLAGWPDDRPLWSGSCPCQPFSAAGKRQGTADPRHLWPVFWPLIHSARPAVVVGEQVSGADGLAWLDGVLGDLEAGGYAGRALVVPAGAVGAPHRRERLWWLASLADPNGQRCQQPPSRDAGRPLQTIEGVRSISGDVADADRDGREAGRGAVSPTRYGHSVDASGGERCGVGDAARQQCAEWVGEREDAREELAPPAGTGCGFWTDAEWLDCADGKRRRVKPGLPLLVDGVPSDVAGMLAGFGNAIVPQVAAEVLGAWLDCRP